MGLTTLEIILLAGLAFILAVIVILVFKGSIRTIKIGKTELMFGKQSGPTLDEDAARLYTREAVRLTNTIGVLERREMLAEMMRHGEEGLTLVCNMLRSDFREFIFSRDLGQEEIEQLIQENEIVVNQLAREMHGWILLAMRQNCIPLDDAGLEKYVMEKFHLWDGESDEIRRQVGRNKIIHQEFLVANRPGDDRYIRIMTSFFKKAGKAKAEIMERIKNNIVKRQELEDHFATTAKVKPVNCEGCHE
jgi:hypothetical protein